jgi:Flp pilus assembly protein CpaB
LQKTPFFFFAVVCYNNTNRTRLIPGLHLRTPLIIERKGVSNPSACGDAPGENVNLDKKTKMVAGCGAILALLAGYAMYTATSKVENLVPVVVATKNIEPRTKITEDMVKIEQIPALARNDSMLDDTSLVVGGYATTHIYTGQDFVQPMVSKQFDPNGASGYAGAIPDPSLRAVSFPVNVTKAAGGKISKGDYVDVIATFAPNGGGQKLTKTVLQGVEVFDTNLDSSGDSSDSSSNGSGEPYITLLLRLDYAEMLNQIGADNLSYALNPMNPTTARTTGAIDELICKRFNFNCSKAQQ